MGFQFKIFLGFLGSIALVVLLSVFAVVTIGQLAQQTRKGKDETVANVRRDSLVIEKAGSVVDIAQEIERRKSRAALESFRIETELESVFGTQTEIAGLPENMRTQVSQFYIARKNFLGLWERLPKELELIEARCHGLRRGFLERINGLSPSGEGNDETALKISIARNSLADLALAASNVIAAAEKTIVLSRDEDSFARFEDDVMASIMMAQRAFAGMEEGLSDLEGGPALRDEITEAFSDIFIGFVDEEGISLQLEQLTIKSNSLDAAAANLYDSIQSVLQEAIARSRAVAVEMGDQLDAVTDRSLEARSTIAWMCVAAVVVSVGMGFWIPRRLSKRLVATSLKMSEVTNAMAVASEQVKSASNVFASGSEGQAASLEETFATLQDISTRSEENTSNAEKTAATTRLARKSAEDGVSEIVELESAMTGIQQSSSEIAEIIGTIENIAFQTNILALNAAVEAARAGQAGAGFAVVADEVRNLAQRVSTAAHETGGKIEQAIENSERGTAVSALARKRLEEIVARIREADGYVAVIASATAQQSSAIAQTAETMREMDAVARSTANSAQHTSDASLSLERETIHLWGAVDELETLLDGRRKNSQPSARAC